MTIRKLLAVAGLVALGTVATVAPAGAQSNGHDHGRHRPKSMHFDDFVGVPADMLGAAGAIRGVNGGLAAWSIGQAEVKIRSTGEVEVEFDDLIFASGPNTGKNTVASMAVVLTCIDGAGNPTKAVSAPFAVSVANGTDPGGDADTTTTIALPEVCRQPIALITNGPGSAWFAQSMR